MACNFGSRKKATAPDYFSPDSTSSICFLIGVESNICQYLDKIPTLLIKYGDGETWESIIKSAAKSVFKIVVNSSDDIDVENFCLIEPPPLPNEITFDDIANFLISYTPPFSTYINATDGLISKITAYYLYSKWYEFCECSPIPPLPDIPDFVATKPPRPPKSPCVSEDCNIFFDEINTLIQNEQASAQTRLMDAMSNKGTELADQVSVLNASLNEESNFVSYTYSFSEVNVFPYATIDPNEPNGFRFYRFYYQSGFCFAHCVSMAANVKFSILAFDRSGNKTVISGDYLSIKDFSLIEYFDDTQNCAPPPPPSKRLRDRIENTGGDLFCTLFPDDPICLNLTNNGGCESITVTVREFSGCNQKRTFATRTLLNSGDDQSITLVEFDVCGQPRNSKNLSLFNCIPQTVDIYGCTDPTASNYNSQATIDDGSCSYVISGCTDPTASNYNSQATIDDGSCSYISGICEDYYDQFTTWGTQDAQYFVNNGWDLESALNSKLAELAASSDYANNLGCVNQFNQWYTNAFNLVAFP